MSTNKEVRSVEEIVKDFGNSIAFQLKPSNDTMEAVRLVRKELTILLTAEHTAQREMVEEIKNLDQIWGADESTKLLSKIDAIAKKFNIEVK
jgi:ABC-type uncharacterized transport system substrate-binding protein